MKQGTLSKEDFIAYYVESNMLHWNAADMERLAVVLPCSCEDQNCKGWVSIPKSLPLIMAHNQNQNPFTQGEIWVRLNQVIMDHLESHYRNTGILNAFKAQPKNGYVLHFMYDFIAECIAAFSAESDLDAIKLQMLLETIYQRIYLAKTPLTTQELFNKQKALLIWIEVRLFGKEIVHPKVLEALQSDPAYNLNRFSQTHPKEQELAELYQYLADRGRPMKVGQKWKIRGVEYAVFLPQTLNLKTDFTLERLGESNNPFRHFLLSEMLPIAPQDIELRFPS